MGNEEGEEHRSVAGMTISSNHSHHHEQEHDEHHEGEQTYPDKVIYVSFQGDGRLVARVDANNGNLLAIYQG